MSARCKDITGIIDRMAPAYLAMDHDNVGMIIGNEDSAVNSVLIALDIDEDVINEALENRCQLIITHHPIIFTPIKSIISSDFKGKLIYRLISNNINAYAAHTNLDAADNGINDYLAKGLGLTDIYVLGKVYTKQLYKLAVYVPAGYENAVREALYNAGAGSMGNYRGCTFNTTGEGTFMPVQGSNPFIGEIGVMEHTQEVKIETVIYEDKIKDAAAAMIKAHPYEEPAYDIYPLFNAGNEYGFGRAGYLPSPLTLNELCTRVKEMLKIDSVNVTGKPGEMISKVGIMSGDGSDFIMEALKTGCDAFITGDIRYHDACDARDMGIALIDAGHFSTENIYMAQLLEILKKEALLNNIAVDFYLSSSKKNPFIKV